MEKVFIIIQIFSKSIFKYGLIYALPYYLFLKFSPYPLPYLNIFVILLLTFSQYVFFSKKEYRKKITKDVIEKLTLENNGKQPAQKIINERLNLINEIRYVALFFIALILLSLSELM